MREYNKKILFLVSQSENYSNGGVESISEIIKRSSLDKHVITNRNTSKVYKWKSYGAIVSIFEYDKYIEKRRIRKFDYLVRSNIWAYKYVTSLQPSVVHANDRAAFRSFALGVLGAGIPIVNNVRDTAPDMSGFRRVKWLAEFALSDIVLMLSDEMCRRWTRVLGVQSLPDMIRSRFQSKLSYIYSAVDVDHFHPVAKGKKKAIRNDLGLHGSPLLTYVASFHPKKNQISVIRNVLPQLIHQYPDLKIAFVGDFEPSKNAHADSCRRAVEHLGLSDNVLFVGYRDDIERWYQAADMTLLASSKEGLARSMIESLTCGTPVISFEVASAREILEEYNCGIVVPHGSYVQLVEAITELWEDDSLRTEMAERGVSAALELFNSESIAQQYQALYEEVATGA